MSTVLNNENLHSSSIDNFHLRSNVVKDFISRKPNFFVRWGTYVFFLILISIFLFSFFIKYPDLVVAKARLIDVNAPKEVTVKTEARLEMLFVNNGDKVKKGDVLAYIESTADKNSVSLLKFRLDTILLKISKNSFSQIKDYFIGEVETTQFKSLGELQQSYENFIQKFMRYRDFISDGFYLRKIQFLNKDVESIKQLQNILEEQESLLLKDLILTQKTVEINELLVRDKVISELDYRNDQSRLIAKQLSLPPIKMAKVNNEKLKNDKQKEKEEILNQIVVEKQFFIQAINSLLNEIYEWELKYILKAPVDGTVELKGIFQLNQSLKNGQLLFYIQPDNVFYFTELQIPQYNFGKVKVGQEVLLKFEAYPAEQFGSIKARIHFISATPSDSGFYATALLTEGLTTNYKKTIEYKYMLIAQADIITENVSLSQRIFNNLRKQIYR
jgi:HlyD family secretion protein